MPALAREGATILSTYVCVEETGERKKLEGLGTMKRGRSGDTKVVMSCHLRPWCYLNLCYHLRLFCSRSLC